MRRLCIGGPNDGQFYEGLPNNGMWLTVLDYVPGGVALTELPYVLPAVTITTFNYRLAKIYDGVGCILREFWVPIGMKDSEILPTILAGYRVPRIGIEIMA